MEDDEPPSNLKRNYNSSRAPISQIITIDPNQDLEGILLNPDPELNELAVLNPSLYQENNEGPWPFIYRTEIPSRNGRTSIIDFRLLETPTQLSKGKRTIISPNPKNKWESKGCEDPRLTKIGDKYYITYIAFDGFNARVALASTTDFKTIKKHGIISPQITLNEAAGIVNDDFYKKTWEKIFIKKFNNLEDKSTPLYLWDKDAALDYDYKNNEWVLIHRIEPHLHIAKAKKIKDFQTKEYWVDYLKNINQHIPIKINEPWASDKGGWGSTFFNIGDKKVILIHGVDEKLNYYGTFCELDDSYNIVSIIKNPLFKSGEDDLFEYIENGIKKNKKVIFPTGALVQRDRLFVYPGSADKRIKYRSTDSNWVYSELNHPENRVKQKHKKQLAQTA